MCDDDDGDSLKDDLMMMMMMMIPSLSFPKKGVKCAHHTRFFCVPATRRRKKDEERERERENTTIIVQKEESSSRDAVQERTRTGQKPETREIESKPRVRENSCALPFQFPIPRGRKALLV